MEYPCILVRLYEDGKVEVDKDLYFDYDSELDISLNGYITLLLEKEFYTDIYVVSNRPGVCQAYLEGFLIGRNIDYIVRKDLLAEKDYQMLVQTSFSKLRVK